MEAQFYPRILAEPRTKERPLLVQVFASKSFLYKRVIITSIAIEFPIKRVQSNRCWFFTTGNILPNNRQWNQFQSQFQRIKSQESSPALIRSWGRPDLMRTSRSTNPRDMRPRVRPAISPAKATRDMMITRSNQNAAPQHEASDEAIWVRQVRVTLFSSLLFV